MVATCDSRSATGCIAGLAALWGVIQPTEAQVNLTQHHNHDSRDGFYIDPVFTQTAAGNLTRDLGFNGTLRGSCLRGRLVRAQDRIGRGTCWQSDVTPSLGNATQ